MEKECGSKLLVTTGLINFGSCDTNTGKCNDDYLHKHMNVLKDSGKVKKNIPFLQKIKKNDQNNLFLAFKMVATRWNQGKIS